MCRYTASLSPDNPQHLNYPSYNGDRILVGKFLYELSDPRRWDVIVFKFPGDAPTNYIKRLVGLPGETVRIQHGDIWIRSAQDAAKGDAGFRIARKPPQKLLAMLQPVFDNDYMPRIAEYGWPARWYADTETAAGGKPAGA
jgi:signal peptidase I